MTNDNESSPRVEEIPEGCTPADAKVLREANHRLGIENHNLHAALDAAQIVLRDGRIGAARDIIYNARHAPVEESNERVPTPDDVDGRTHIYCNNCEAIMPLLIGEMEGDDVSGKFTDAADLLCKECHLVLSTIYNPKQNPSPSDHSTSADLRPPRGTETAVGLGPVSCPNAASVPVVPMQGDDIVKVIREAFVDVPGSSIAQRAADEIERLRKRVYILGAMNVKAQQDLAKNPGPGLNAVQLVPVVGESDGFGVHGATAPSGRTSADGAGPGAGTTDEAPKKDIPPDHWVYAADAKPPSSRHVLVWCPKNECQFIAYWRDDGWFLAGATLLSELPWPVTRWKHLGPSPESSPPKVLEIDESAGMESLLRTSERLNRENGESEERVTEGKS